MTTRRQMPDGPSPNDREVERTIHDALQAPPIRDAFSLELSKKLQNEFEAVGSITNSVATPAEKLGSGNDAGALNGHAFLDEALDRSSPDSIPAADNSPERAGFARRSLRRPMFVAAAAAVLLVVGFWSSQPSYSWANMIEAIAERPWVHAEAVRDGVVRVRRWVAAGQGVDASQADGKVELTTYKGGVWTTLSHNQGDDKILSSQSRAKTSSDWNALLPDLLFSPDAANHREPGIELLDESWRHTRSADGRRLVELTVELMINGNRERWVLLLDPKTHLPVSATPAESDVAVRFSYPQQGPTSMVALGVADQTQIVSLDAANRQPESDLLALEPKKSELLPQNLEPLGDPLTGVELTNRIDDMLKEHWRSIGISPVRQSSDEEFLRRAYLDLTGRIPTVGEARIFFEDQLQDRRGRLIDKLLGSRDHATHLAAVWRRGLIPASVDLTPYGGSERLDQWLADRFQDNMPYDEMARQLLLAEGRISESGPLLFYAALKLNPEEIAAQTSRTFLGMQLDCAQCHDHPFDYRLSQEDFWGFAALFAQISRPRGQMDVTSPVLRVFDNRRGEVTLPDTDTVVAPRLPLTDRAVRDGQDAPPRRHQFVDWLVEPRNERFSKAAVNRVWAHLFGRGLVEPVDDIREENPAVVVELLDLLAEDFARSGFDLRRLLRRIVATDAYQLTSESEDADPARALVFAQMNIKSFTAEQLHDCIAVATRSAAMAGRGTDSFGIQRFGDTSRDQFIQLFDAPGGKPVDYHGGIPQALTMMHGGVIHSATDLTTSGLLKSLSAPFFTDKQRVETLFLATLSRRPTENELAPMSSHVAAALNDQDRQSRLGDVLWALLNTAEFTLNH